MNDQEELDKLRAALNEILKASDLNGVRTLVIVEALISTAGVVFMSHGGSLVRFGERLEERGQDIQKHPEKYMVS